VRHAVPWLASWCALFGLWLLLAGEWNRTEWIAAALAATVSATIGDVARRRAGVGGPFPWRVLARGWTIPHQVVADFGVVMWALVASVVRRRVVRGGFHRRAYAAPAFERALATLLANYSPNAYVVDVDGRHASIHDLIEWRRSEEPVG
jgi:hypothetical protein